METKELITNIATQNALDPNLVAAFCFTESSFNPSAVRFEPLYSYLVNTDVWARRMWITNQTEIILQKTSWGLMQVMGAVARELGLTGPIITLSDPEIGLKYGCIKLKKCMDKYPKLEDAISAYNAGSVRLDDKGKYSNQAYVDKILAKYNDFKKGDQYGSKC